MEKNAGVYLGQLKTDDSEEVKNPSGQTFYSCGSPDHYEKDWQQAATVVVIGAAVMVAQHRNGAM